MYYPTVVQPTWSNPVNVQHQVIPTVYYQTPSNVIPPDSTAQTDLLPQQATSTTTTKVTTTRVIDSTTTSNVEKNSIVDETNVKPTVETTTIDERPQIRPRHLRSPSISTYSDSSTPSSKSTISSKPEIIKPPTMLPSQIPIQTTNIMPMRRVIHHAYRSPRTPSSHYSSDLDYEKRKVYKTDYKYRHYYCCNWCKGRWDLHNRAYACCEWFYGCPVWSLILCGLIFLALLVTFLTLFGLQPALNSARYSETAQTRLLNRTEVIYGFYALCGYQINATSNTATTLILCTNTATTTTARIQLSPFYTVINGTTKHLYSKIFLLIFLFIHFNH